MKKPLTTTHYHSVLRIALVVFAFLLVFDSGLIDHRTTKLSSGAMDYMANAVGVRVGVAENEVNVLTARITELEQELERKDREIAVRLDTETDAAGGFDASTFVLSVILFILLLLIILNYIMDYLRDRQRLVSGRLA